MITRIPITGFLEMAANTPVLDVRSPKEYLQGHLPGSFNLPLFDDSERAIVGTIYKNSGRDSSVLKGMELAGPKMASFVKKANTFAPGREVLVHCWRGGMRSENMAWLLDQAGFRVTVLDGGYKSYRRFIRSELPRGLILIVLGGLTGSGKTEALEVLKEMGEQVINLERLGNHKGSVFGGLGEDPQPTNEQFENDLFAVRSSFDLSKPVWAEDESRMLGRITIPDPFFKLMGNSPLIRVDVPLETRIQRLVQGYSGYPSEELCNALSQIYEKLGGARTRTAIDAIRSGYFGSAVELILGYYDKAYLNALSKRSSHEIRVITADHSDPRESARMILECAHDIVRRRKEYDGAHIS